MTQTARVFYPAPDDISWTERREQYGDFHIVLNSQFYSNKKIGFLEINGTSLSTADVDTFVIYERPDICNPHKFFAPVWSQTDIPVNMRIECGTTGHAEMFAALFDPLPDPLLLRYLALCYYDGALQWVVVSAHDSDNSGSYVIPYQRDAMREAHYWAHDRTDTRVHVVMRLQIGDLLPYHSHEEYMEWQRDTIVRIRNTLGDVVPQLKYWPVAFRSLSHLEGYQIWIVFREQGILMVHFVTTVGRRARVTRQVGDSIAQLFGARLVQRKFYPLFDSLPLPKDYAYVFSWRNVHYLLRETLLALEPLGLPIYVLYWILEREPSVAAQREFRVIRLIEGVLRSAARVRIEGVPEPRYRLRKRVKRDI